VSETDIKNLILEAKNGNGEAFGRVYQEYLAPIYRFIYFRVPNKLEAEDLTQEVFLRAFHSLNRFALGNNSPVAYFYRIARNLLIDNYRKKKTVEIDIDLISETMSTGETPQNEAIKQDEIINLKKALDKISENEREVLILKFIDDYDNSEIAEIMEKSEEAVRQLQSRGLKSLRQLISNSDFNL
jgi:RNA polymerase sigma-70 factor (ECF subfamily)